MRPGGLMLIDAAGADANKSFRFKQKGSFGGTPQTNILISAEKCVLHLLVNFSVRCLKGVQQKKKKITTLSPACSGFLQTILDTCSYL